MIAGFTLTEHSTWQLGRHEEDFTEKQFGEVGGLDVVIVDNGGDASHEGQTCRHVEVKMERLAEPAETNKRRQSRTQPADTALFGHHSSMFGTGVCLS